MIVDLTYNIQNGLPLYPGDTETILVQNKCIRTDYHNNHLLTISMHAGTHIDGPMHLLEGQPYLNEFSLASFMGEGCLLDVKGCKKINALAQYEQSIQEGQIVILYTGFGEYFGQPRYFTEYPVMTMEFAELLVRKKVKMVGMDLPSPDFYPFEVHKLLLRNRILIAENLAHVEQLLDRGPFEVIALPLNIRADSSPARVVARFIHEP